MFVCVVYRVVVSGVDFNVESEGLLVFANGLDVCAVDINVEVYSLFVLAYGVVVCG